MNQIIESIPNLYEMVGNVCGYIRPFDYREICPHHCPRCQGEEGFFILTELESPQCGRTLRSLPIRPEGFMRLLQQSSSLSNLQDVERVLGYRLFKDGVGCPKPWREEPLARDYSWIISRNPWYFQPPMEPTGKYALVWLTLRNARALGEAVLSPDAGIDWRVVAERWLGERIPDIGLYSVSIDRWREDLPPRLVSLPSLIPRSVGSSLRLGRRDVIKCLASLPSMTRFELLMEPDRATEYGPLCDWYEGNVSRILRIGDRLVWMDDQWKYYAKHSVPKLHRCVADQLAIASTMMGFTALSVQEVALLAVNLWAYAGLKLGPLMSTSAFPSTSPILTTYLLHTVEDQEILTDMLRKRCRLDSSELWWYNGGYRFHRWKVPQRKLISVLDLIRTNTGKPRIKEYMEVHHAGAK